MQETKKKKKQIKRITILSMDEIIFKLKQILKYHIGKHNGISQPELFKSVFGDVSQYSNLQQFYLWEQMKKAMHHLRKHSFYFVVAFSKKGLYHYCIVRSQSDADMYIDRMEKVKKQIGVMQRRCQEAVDKQFWRKLDEN